MVCEAALNSVKIITNEDSVSRYQCSYQKKCVFELTLKMTPIKTLYNRVQQRRKLQLLNQNKRDGFHFLAFKSNGLPAYRDDTKL